MSCIFRCLISYLSAKILKESAAECLREIISKGMEPIPKVELVESLAKQIEGAQILSTVNDEVQPFLFVGYRL